MAEAHSQEPQNDHALEARRHTLAHLLAAAVLTHYPHAKPTIGPPISNGFYYDFDFGSGPKPRTQEDLERITATMRALLPQWKTWQHEEVSPEEARARFADNPYKRELIDELEREGATITLYTCGGFTDLCRGGHTPNPANDIDPESFVIDRIAGAYWRGNERNPMLTRIYGLAFASRDDLAAFLAAREEARKRDHRRLGRELDLFVFSELVGPGLPLWTPRGTTLRMLLDAYVWTLREPHGYQRVTIPHITRRALYERSGHWEKFADELFRIVSREGREYALKPMNCPHHTQIFAAATRSWRDMPQRYAETTMVYRDEQSGELGGLTRVLSITQDDSHVFCRVSQIEDEFFRIWDIIDQFYRTFAFELRVRLSFHDPATPERYLGSPDVWKRAERALESIAQRRGADAFVARGEAAMYGPKLDFLARDSLGREHQVATVQLDFNLPERFQLSCVNEEGEEERVVMIHCAVMGSLERFIAVLLEHTGGHLPFWLAPVQVVVAPVGESHHEAAEQLVRHWRQYGLRISFAEPTRSLNRRVRDARTQRIPVVAVIGSREAADGSVTLTHTPTHTQRSLSRREATDLLLRHHALGSPDLSLNTPM